MNEIKFNTTTKTNIFNLKDFVDQLINITWVPEAFMILALTLLMFMLAFRKEKSKRVFIRMIVFIYILILFLYWHNYNFILPGLKFLVLMPCMVEQQHWYLRSCEIN